MQRVAVDAGPGPILADAACRRRRLGQRALLRSHAPGTASSPATIVPTTALVALEVLRDEMPRVGVFTFVFVSAGSRTSRVERVRCRTVTAATFRVAGGYLARRRPGRGRWAPVIPCPMGHPNRADTACCSVAVREPFVWPSPSTRPASRPSWSLPHHRGTPPPRDHRRQAMAPPSRHGDLALAIAVGSYGHARVDPSRARSTGDA